MSDPHSSATDPSLAPRDASPPPADQYPGLSEAQRIAVDAYLREMTHSVIPEIIEAIEERRNSASLSRHWQLKTGG